MLQLTRRDFLKLCGTSSLGLALAACGVGATPTTTPAPTNTVLPTSTPFPSATATLTSTPAPTSTATATATVTSTPLPITLRDYADRLGKNIGVEALTGGNDSKRLELVKNEFNQITITAFTWPRSRPSINEFVLDIPRSYASRAQTNSQIARAQALIWGANAEIPSNHWLKQTGFSRDQLIEIMRTHIRTVMNDKQLATVKEWVVVNEGTQSHYFWIRGIGADFVEIAFRAAREANPNATLIYNDFGFEYSSLPYSQRVFALVKNLKEKGLIDAVGMQMHFLGGNEHPDPNLPLPQLKQAILNQIRVYADLGISVLITELDVDLNKIPGDQEQKMKIASGVYQVVSESYLESPNCKGLTVWGINSNDSWITGLGGTPALLFGDNKPQQPYYATLEAFKSKLK